MADEVKVEVKKNSFATVTAKYNDKYEYSSFDVVTYTNITNIKPLTAKKSILFSRNA